MQKIAIVGAGIGGLTSAIHLKGKGFDVSVFEAGDSPGGLASGVHIENTDFDGGPYILLDRPGLEWAFQRLALNLADLVTMQAVENIYEVLSAEHLQAVRIFHSLDRTVELLEATQPGAGKLYAIFVKRMRATYNRLSVLQRQSEPGLWKLIRHGAWRDIPFLLKPLDRVIRDAGIRGPLGNALGIWTHIAGQELNEAPSPLALVPAVIHEHGCYLPTSGIREVPRILAEQARARGVEFHFNSAVARIEVRDQTAVGVQLSTGKFIPSDAVISNISGVGTYTDLVGDTSSATVKLRALPLQSPGFCIYMLCKGRRPEFYLRFMLKQNGCQLFISPQSVLPHSNPEWWPARLLQPLKHGSRAESDSQTQQALIDELLHDQWWQAGITGFRVVKVRTTRDWGREFHLYRNSMNPAMTAKFMRMGRIPHRSSRLRRLYHAGSSTHPGQWVSFAAISGVLAADTLAGDLL